MKIILIKRQLETGFGPTDVIIAVPMNNPANTQIGLNQQELEEKLGGKFGTQEADEYEPEYGTEAIDEEGGYSDDLS